MDINRDVEQLAETVSRVFQSSCESETIGLGAAIGAALGVGDLVILIGDMGAGKTRLAKGMVSAATQVNPDDVVSPSFSLINRYEGVLTVDHADLYRLVGSQSDELGIYEGLEEAAVVIEWGQPKKLFDDNELQIVLKAGEDEHSRIIELSCASGGSWDKRLSDILDNPGKTL